MDMNASQVAHRVALFCMWGCLAHAPTMSVNACGQQFEPLMIETAPDAVTRALNVSHDGNVVVGTAILGGTERAVAWDATQSATVLPALKSDHLSSQASAANINGSVIVGTIHSLTASIAVAWFDQMEPTVLAGDLSSTDHYTAFDVSADGTVVVGTVSRADGSNQAFRWSVDAGVTLLEPWLADQPSCGAFAVSADGTLIGGWTELDGQRIPVVWLPSLVPAPSPQPGRSGVFGEINAIAQGLVYYTVGEATEGGLITAITDQPIGGATIFRGPGSTESRIRGTDVSFGLYRIAGEAIPPDVPAVSRAFVLDWYSSSDWLDSILLDLGTNLMGWQNLSTIRMSADGHTVVGEGLNAIGVTQAYRARLPIPCYADANRDGVLTPADFNAWILSFNNSGFGCDQNLDGRCTPADFNAWILNFNGGCP